MRPIHRAILLSEGQRVLHCCKTMKNVLDIGFKHAHDIMPCFGGNGILAENVSKKRALEIKALIEEDGAIVKIERKKEVKNEK